MSSIQEALFNVLKSDPSIASKVEYEPGKFHIYPINLPEGVIDQKDSNYFIAYHKVSNPKKHDIDLENSVIQIDVLARAYRLAEELAEDIKRLLERFKGNLGGKRDVKNVKLVSQTELRHKDTYLYHFPLQFRFKFYGNNI